MDESTDIFEHYSRSRLNLIDWRHTKKNNVEVLNQTVNLYRFFDATAHAEFLFHCVHQTITDLLPNEVRYLENFDRFKQFINNTLDLPDRLVNLLVIFLEQGKGTLSKRALTKEFQQLDKKEIAAIEKKYKEVFE
jgi:hypothetical protein